MQKSSRRFLFLAVAGLIAVAMTPAVWTSDARLAPVEPADTVAAGTAGAFTPSGLVTSCYPGTRLTCEEVPVPVGASCSCTTIALNRKCYTCDGAVHFLYETTCTVVAPCNNPPCDLNGNHRHTAYSCE